MIKKDKIFIGFFETAGYASNLQLGFNKLGVKNVFITFSKHSFEYDIDKKQSIYIKYLQFIADKHSKKKCFYIFTILHFFNKIILFLWALFNYNTFIFFNQGSFLNNLDLPILKFFKKKIIYVFFGSAMRPPYVNGGYFYGQKNNYDQVEILSRNIYKSVDKFSQYANYIIMPTSISHFMSTKLIDLVQIGFPMEPITQVKKNKKKNFNHIVILHSPSLKKQKGTDIINKIISELKAEGYKIDYRQISNLPNVEVLKELDQCDFVIDQVFSDYPMAGFATEAAYYSKPAIVGGYYEKMNSDIKMKELPPVYYVDPSLLKIAIIKMIEDEHFRKNLGKRAKKFVRNYYKPENVAKRYLKLANDQPESNWIFNPKDISYIYGWGTPKKRLKEFLKGYIKEKGDAALYLDHSPKIKQRFLDFINE